MRKSFCVGPWRDWNAAARRPSATDRPLNLPSPPRPPRSPDNFAFDHLPAGVLPDLLKNITLLDEILTYHVVSGNVSVAGATDAAEAATTRAPTRGTCGGAPQDCAS